jgi:hypothetical protein
VEAAPCQPPCRHCPATRIRRHLSPHPHPPAWDIVQTHQHLHRQHRHHVPQAPVGVQSFFLRLRKQRRQCGMNWHRDRGRRQITLLLCRKRRWRQKRCDLFETPLLFQRQYGWRRRCSFRD